MPIKLTSSPKILGGPTPKALIQQMVTSYKNNLKAVGDVIISSKFPLRLKKSQVSCAWISVAELNQLIADNKADGIRIYFGQHTASSLPTGKNDYEDLISVIFVATQEKVTPANPSSLTSQDQLIDDLNSVTITGPFEGQGADKVPVCDPDCPGTGMMLINI